MRAITPREAILHEPQSVGALREMMIGGIVGIHYTLEHKD